MVATIGILASLLLPILGKAKSKAQQANCLSNLRQLGVAWSMYYVDNNDLLVESYPVNNTNVWVQGDMTRLSDATNTDLIANGKLSQELYQQHAANVAIYRCPSDSGVTIDGQNVRSVRSYSMNCFMGARDPSLPPIPSTAAGFVPFFAKNSDLLLRQPSELWVLLDEDSRSINDGFFITDPTARVWYELPSISARRHKYSYSLNFADGHSAIWRLRDMRTRDLSAGTNEQAANADLERLARASTTRK